MTDPIKLDTNLSTQSPVEIGRPDTAVASPRVDTLGDSLIIVPARNTVLFPGALMPITVGRPRSIAAAQEAARSNLPIGVVLQRNPEIDDPLADDLYTVGTVASVLRYIAAPDGTHHLVVQGTHRFRVREFLPDLPYLVARIDAIDEPDQAKMGSPEGEARLLQLKQRALEVIQLLPEPPAELVALIQEAVSPAALADLIAALLDIEPADKQALLEMTDYLKRADRVLEILVHRAEVMRISRDISSQTKKTDRKSVV